MATHHVRSSASAAVDGAAQESAPSWGLLEAFAWLDNVEDATTAVSETPDNKHIKITFCPRAPPLLSRFCIHTPDGADIYKEPSIVATEDDLALLRVDSGGPGKRLNYYIYQAVDGSGKPSLTLLPRFPFNLYFQPKDIGLIRRPGKEYIVVGFRSLPPSYPYGGLSVCVYDSKRPGWKFQALSLSQQGQQEYRDKFFLHKNCKVLTVGGDAGTMAFVDLWQGMLFCDVLTLGLEAKPQENLEAIPLLGYISLPEDLRTTAKVKGNASLFRDIAFLDGHLKCVDLASRSLWIRPATTTSGAWRQQYMIRSFREIAYRNPRVNLLPGFKTVYQSFTGLHVRQPVVDLQDDDDDGRILYFSVKTNQTATQGSVLALDLKTKKILGVAPFTVRRVLTYDFTYMHTRLFKHFSGAKASLNQSGMVLQGSASKMKDKAQEQLDGESVAEAGDAMALD